MNVIRWYSMNVIVWYSMNVIEWPIFMLFCIDNLAIFVQLKKNTAVISSPVKWLILIGNLSIYRETFRWNGHL